MDCLYKHWHNLGSSFVRIGSVLRLMRLAVGIRRSAVELVGHTAVAVVDNMLSSLRSIILMDTTANKPVHRKEFDARQVQWRFRRR